MRRGALAALLLLALAAGRAAGALPKAQGWREVRSAHFVVIGDATESRLRDVALTLERFRAVLASLTSGQAVNDPVTTTVYVFADEEAFRPYKPLALGKPAAIDGFFRGNGEGNVIALSARWNADPRRIVYHELLHEFMTNNFPPQPVWLREGLAEYYSTFEADEKGATLGKPVGHHVRLLRESAPDPIGTILGVTHDSPEYQKPALRYLFYAESWALVHLFLHSDPPRTGALFSYLRAVREGTPRAEAFRRAFGTTEEKLLSELVAYARASRFAYARLEFHERIAVPTGLSVRAMTESEVLVRLAELLEGEGAGRRAEVAEHLAAALARSPCHAQGLALLARLAEADRRLDEAQRLLEEAAAHDPLDPRLAYELGRILMRRAAVEDAVGSVRPRVAAARAAFRRSLDLDPWQPLVHAQLGRTYFLDEGDAVREGILELEMAAERLPGRPDLAADLARLYRRAGEQRRGEELARLSVELEQALPDDSIQRSLARGLREVNRLLELRREEDAIELLGTLAARQPPEVREELERDRARLRATAGRNAEVRRFNDAVALLNAQQLDRALEAFRAIAAEAKDAQIAQRSKEHAAQIEAFRKRGRRS